VHFILRGGDLDIAHCRFEDCSVKELGWVGCLQFSVPMVFIASFDPRGFLSLDVLCNGSRWNSHRMLHIFDKFFKRRIQRNRVVSKSYDQYYGSQINE
jgi:hypothetical protein